MTEIYSGVHTSTDAVVEFTPAWLEGTKDAPVFYLRVGGTEERGALEAELAAPPLMAGKVYGFELRAAIRDGVNKLLAGDPELATVLDVIEREGDNEAEPLSDLETALLSSIREILSQSWPPYMDLVAQLERRRELAPIRAFKRFCVDVKAKGVTFAVDRMGRVAESTLRKIDPLQLQAAGNKAYSLLIPPSDAEGNSPPPSSSEDGQETSSSDGGSKAGGSSPAGTGRKTRG